MRYIGKGLKSEDKETRQDAMEEIMGEVGPFVKGCHVPLRLAVIKQLTGVKPSRSEYKLWVIDIDEPRKREAKQVAKRIAKF